MPSAISAFWHICRNFLLLPWSRLLCGCANAASQRQSIMQGLQSCPHSMSSMPVLLWKRIQICFYPQVWRPTWNNNHNFSIHLHYVCLSVGALSLYLKLSVLCFGGIILLTIYQKYPPMLAVVEWTYEPIIPAFERLWKNNDEFEVSQSYLLSKDTSYFSSLIRFFIWYFTHIHKAYWPLSSPIFLVSLPSLFTLFHAINCDPRFMSVSF